MPTDGSEKGRKDAILGLETPLMFAHRGGAGEVPESTKEAFRHAVEHGTDVLEVDVSLTHDGKMVLWHGPELENVRGRDQEPLERDVIGDCDWSDLQGKAWVLHPKPKGKGKDKPIFEETDKRLLLLLSEFFEFLDDELPNGRTIPVNIELKKRSGDGHHWTEERLTELFELVDEQSKKRTIILASLDGDLLQDLREHIPPGRTVCHPTSLGCKEQAPYSWYMSLRPFGLLARVWRLSVWKKKRSLINRAFETSHALLSKKLVSEVHERGGSIYPFLTSFWILASKIDHKGGIVYKDEIEDKLVIEDEEGYEALEDELSKLLDMGVDGVMTDYPEKVRILIDLWNEKEKGNSG